MLEVKEARAIVNGFEVLRGITLHVERGEVVAVVGPNGSGKTTLLKAIAGLVPLISGVISLDGEDITPRPARLRALSGIALVPLEGDVFPDLTVSENLIVAGSTLRQRSELEERMSWALSTFRRLMERAHVRASALSGGERRMLAIAMGLLRRPKVLLLDEPSSGLSPAAMTEVASAVKSARSWGISTLVAEQNLDAATLLADRVYVMKGGRAIAEAHASDRETLDRAFASSYWVT